MFRKHLAATILAVTAICVPARAATAAPDPAIERWHRLALTVGWTAHQWPHLACILWRETRGNPDEINSAGATGLTQILWPVHGAWLQARGVTQQILLDPTQNLFFALNLYRWEGWSPWHSPSSRCDRMK
jgi:Transglycosylase SLT domain